jgi:glycosyltransferase involved in cell wall biosynthesis
MNTEPLVSVVLIVKNGERFIVSSLESILASSYSNIEVLVIDGDSHDSTAELVRQFGAPVALHAQTEPGIANAWNQGIDTARGDFVAFHSSDDLWQPEKLRNQMNVLLTQPEIEFVVGKVEFFVEPGASVSTGFRTELLESPRPAYIPEALLARRRLLDRIGNFDPDFAISEDVDWFARCRDASVQGTCLDEVVVRKRIHENNVHLSTRSNAFLLEALARSTRRKRALAADG